MPHLNLDFQSALGSIAIPYFYLLLRVSRLQLGSGGSVQLFDKVSSCIQNSWAKFGYRCTERGMAGDTRLINHLDPADVSYLPVPRDLTS